MEQVREKLGSFDDSWSGSREIRVRVHRVDATVPNSRYVSPAFIQFEALRFRHGLGKIETARHDDQDFRRPAQNISPGDPDRIGAFTAHSIDAAGNPNHLRNPMPTAIDRV